MKRGTLTLPSGATMEAPENWDLAASVPKSIGSDEAFSLALMQLVYRHDKTPADLVARTLELKRLLLAPES